MFDFPPFTRDTAPMRNSCDVLAAYIEDGVSHARLILADPYGGNDDREYTPKRVQIPKADIEDLTFPR